MVKQNPVINIALKRFCYLSPPHFLMLVAICTYFFSLTLTYQKRQKPPGIRLSFCFVLKPKTTLFHLLSFTVTCCHSLYHSLSLDVSLVSQDVIHCHSLSFVVPLVVTRCITRLSFNKRSSYIYI